MENDLEIYKELAAKYFKAKEYFEEMYRIVDIEAKGYWQCLENKQKGIDALLASHEKLKEALKEIIKDDCGLETWENYSMRIQMICLSALKEAEELCD